MHKLFYYTFISLLLILNSCQEDVKQVPPPTGVTVITAIQIDLPIYRDFVGSIYGYKDIPIRARVEGFLESINFEEGTQVKKGQLLYTIDSQPFQADVAASQSKVTEAETKLVNAENELARYRPLADSKAVSESDVDAAQATRDAAEANLHAAEANLSISEINLSYAAMKSPLNGIIGRTAARIGEYVGKEPNPVILNTVSRLDTVRVQFFLTESQYLRLVRSYIKDKKVNPAQAEKEDHEKPDVRLTLSDGSTYDHTGLIDFVDRNVQESTGSILVQASFPNPDRLLRPGLYAKVRIMFAYQKDAVIIPQRSVMEIQGKYSVMVLTDSNTVQARPIMMGEKIDGSWQVISGLKSGEKIIYEGLQKARSGSKVNPTETPYIFETK
ncbi:MAG: membrane fusion protein (multidrug efflux system) [Salibacteraceae bacterium]|jgi:membrane fusion protein (multidrug efflux system)